MEYKRSSADLLISLNSSSERRFVHMKLILLAPPPSFITASMPRFVKMIRQGMTRRGHTLEVWTSGQVIGRLSVRSCFVRKWLRYVDQFLIYPRALRRRGNQTNRDSLFVITDQNLGMW